MCVHTVHETFKLSIGLSGSIGLNDENELFMPVELSFENQRSWLIKKRPVYMFYIWSYCW